ncbi:bifunctional diguanylate cyclase/phosphodiesterase [Pseudaminobacter soli (ex Zhang et al. 2022)]|uniref:bifunctional diguanylate cyclase/phosphodiesterase n=1 Tax=Pseudaminobacter soli (ex Zhang et al. 2022) TaxID=2831468 RepID=UPI003081043A
MPAAIAVVVVAILGLFADHQNQILYEQDLRAEVFAKINVIRAKLEGKVNGNIQLVRGLAATLEAEPEITRERFEDLARRVFDNENQLRHVAVSRGFTVTMVYPLKGNERVLGVDLLSVERQRPALVQLRDTGRLVLSGPVDLVQGGQGFVARLPIFTHSNGRENFWGVVSAVIDIDRLYRESELLEEHGLDLALIRQDSRRAKGFQFFGSPATVDSAPVTATIVLPSGQWQIAAVPKGGWDKTPANTWLLRLLIVVAGAMVVVPILVAGRFYDERQRNYRELKRSETKFRRLSQRLEHALGASKVGVWELNLETHEMIWDDRMFRIYGIPRKNGPFTYEDWAGSLHPDDLQRADEDFRRQVAEDRPFSAEYRVVHPNGEVRYIRSHSLIVHDPQDAPRMIGAEWDVTDDVKLNKDLERAKTLAETRSTELEVVKARIEHNALHDSLTDLPNRRYLDAELERRAAECARDGKRIALLHIDLDRFKQINDTLGHAAGDAILVHVARTLRQRVRNDDFVARIGGDEFIIVCEVGPHDDYLAEIAERIVAQMRQPVLFQGHACRFGVSIGIATEGGGPEVDTGRLMVNADIALYRAKSRGRNRFEFFTETLQSEIVRRKKVADDILAGLENDQFTVFYQPQFDANTLEIAGVEALVRWNHPTEGLLTPDAFLSSAEELNVVSTLDRLVLEQALVSFERWNRAGLMIPRISVNVSGRRLRDEELVDSLRRLDIRPGTVSFELLESIFLDDTDDHVSWNLDRLKELGIDIEIDDFGTGYASIVSLMKLQPRRLKIDRQLTQPIVKSARQRQLVESIAEIGKTLGIEVVAEGVETMAHARILRKIGCTKLQGYAFGRPMSAAAFEDYVRAQSWRAAS